MFGNVVLEIPKDAFEHEFDAVKKSAQREAGHRSRRGRAPRGRRAVQGGRARSRAGRDFPQNPAEQLKMSRDAVFRSWMNPRAQEYRRIYDIPDHIGTAVNVQMMVFGNTGDRSAHGRRLHAESGDRQEGVLRRVPHQRAGRGRRRRHPHAAADSPSSSR